MRKIDPMTVQRILDTADIVDVVSDFVSLKRRGSGYIGLCPFHNERTPSFSVSKAKGICKCFSCGKGGSPVGFIMEHEQLSYGEALRYLARKYGIEIQEHEMSEEERQEETERESMLAVNEFALQHFEHNLTETADGRDIGYAYFRERGINDQAIRKFHLGYALDVRDDLLRAATLKGYKEKYLVDTGLCIRSDNGRIYDRFKGRVIYPVFSLSGKVVAFGGRTLRKDKEVAKYVNSPESQIYHKSNVLYGLYQARKSIVAHDKCILVEGYMDVISMHQRGVENVVASSGTSLTEGQIRLIHRFTPNVTVIYDSDPAGIKASLRGIDMLLAEGLNVKVLQLPEGDDPDSFAQSHSASEVEEYIEANETDFIRFKTSILLDGIGANDPIGRARVIADIVRSISVIPEDITRNEYIKECSRLLDSDEKVLSLQVARYGRERIEKEAKKAQRIREREALAPDDNPAAGSQAGNMNRYAARASLNDAVRFMRPYEQEVLRYVLKYGMLYLCDACDDDGNTHPLSVLGYIEAELEADDMAFSNSDFAEAFDAARSLAAGSWLQDVARQRERLDQVRRQALADGIDRIRQTAATADGARTMEEQLRERVDSEFDAGMNAFAMLYIERILGSSPDDGIRRLTTDLVSEKYQLSKVHTKYAKIETEEERLADLVPRAIYEWKDAILAGRIHRLKQKINEAFAAGDSAGVDSAMMQTMELTKLRAEFAKYLGERIVTPKK
ncbi:MAG: DNA primase [Muribaculaceae bacterium]|nr:DNA primase [Muribaculaceae bacterium]